MGQRLGTLAAGLEVTQGVVFVVHPVPRFSTVVEATGFTGLNAGGKKRIASFRFSPLIISLVLAADARRY